MASGLFGSLFPRGMVRALLRRAVAFPAVLPVWQRLELGALELRVEFGISERPYQLYGIYRAAELAKRLGIDAISTIEFGVAGGAGLVAMERIAAEVGQALSMRILVFGFDLGKGLPAPVDYRDLPYLWQGGFYEMDEEKLRQKLTCAELLIGDVSDTVPQFLSRSAPPIGYISFDLDYYSSTSKALEIFSSSPSSRLPRVYCYFDDIMGPDIACHNEHTGELFAIREFNKQRSLKLCPIHGLNEFRTLRAIWHSQMFVLHDFEHPRYCTNISGAEIVRHLPLSEE